MSALVGGISISILFPFPMTCDFKHILVSSFARLDGVSLKQNKRVVIYGFSLYRLAFKVIDVSAALPYIVKDLQVLYGLDIELAFHQNQLGF